MNTYADDVLANAHAPIAPETIAAARRWVIARGGEDVLEAIFGETA